MEAIQRVIDLLSEVGKIPPVTPDQDFYEAGFSSINALQLLMELETAFDVSIPDDRFIAARSAASLCDLVVSLQQESA